MATTITITSNSSDTIDGNDSNSKTEIAAGVPRALADAGVPEEAQHWPPDCLPGRH